MAHGITRIRRDVKKGVVTLTAFGPSVKGRTRLLAQVKGSGDDLDGLLNELLTQADERNETKR